VSRQTQQVVELLELYSSNGKPIVECVPLLGRKVDTLKRHAKINGIFFPDYKPRN
jgi:hypothetical protein